MEERLEKTAIETAVHPEVGEMKSREELRN